MDLSLSDLVDVFMDFSLLKCELDECDKDDFFLCEFKWNFLSSFMFFGMIDILKLCVFLDSEEGDGLIVVISGFVVIECVVCNDKVIGYYYGVFICEGCKGFFKCMV